MRSALLGIGLLTGCVVDDAPPEPIALLDPAALRPVAAADDPLAHHRPADVDCPAATWGPEGGGFEVQTGACTYAAFDQPLPDGIRAGDALAITIWHDRLDGTGHVAVWLDGTILWEAEIEIPGPSRALEAIVPIPESPPPSARLGLHLHNHGFNSWRFVAITLHPR